MIILVSFYEENGCVNEQNKEKKGGIIKKLTAAGIA